MADGARDAIRDVLTDLVAKAGAASSPDVLHDLVERATDEAVALVVPGHPEDYCGRCGAPFNSWTAPSPLWNAVMRRTDTEPWGGVVCPGCFIHAACAAGVTPRTGWRLYCATPLVDLPTVSPGGRHWNSTTWMWDDATCFLCGDPCPGDAEDACAAHDRCRKVYGEGLHDGANENPRCSACGCRSEAHGDEDGEGITCPHCCTGYFEVAASSPRPAGVDREALAEVRDRLVRIAAEARSIESSGEDGQYGVHWWRCRERAEAYEAAAAALAPLLGGEQS